MNANPQPLGKMNDRDNLPIDMTSWMSFVIARLLQGDDHYTLADGERWTFIEIPRFRRSNSPTANQFASTYGRVMANNGSVIYAENDYVKVSVPTLGYDIDSPGHSTMLGLHTVICYTFVGNPPSHHHTTVDHINRKHWDNYYRNLRWATMEQQLNNREICRFLVVFDGFLYSDYTSLSSATKRRITCLRGMIKQGDESLFQIVKRIKYDVNPVSFPQIESNGSIESDKRLETYWGVFTKFIEGTTTADIARDMGLAISTVVNYVVKGARVAEKGERIKFCHRIGLNSKDAIDSLVAAVEEFKQSSPTKDDWTLKGPGVYLKGCELAVPPLSHQDYRIVQGTYKSLFPLLH